MGLIEILLFLLLLFWLIGAIAYPVGGFIHILLVIVLVIVIVRLAAGRPV